MNKRSHSISTMEHWNDTNTCRWFLFVRLFFVLSIILLTVAYSAQFSYAKDKESVDLYLDISFDSNLIMNKYDVTFELDGEKLDTKEYDSYYTKICKVTPGKHVISVYKEDEPEVMGEKNIQIKEDSTFQSQIKTKKKEIEFVEPTKFEGTAGHSIEMPDCVGLHLVDALEVLEQKGFVNYHYEGNTEEKIKEKTWAVDIQNVKAGKKIDKNDEIILTCVPAEEYVKKTFTGLTYDDAIEKAKAIGYKTIQKIDSRYKADEPTLLKEANITDKAKQYWTVKSAEDNYSEDNTLILNFEYNVLMPDLSGKGAKKAESKLESIRQNHFDYVFVGYKSGDSISPKNLKKYKIIEQSIEPGTIIKYSSEVILKCKKTQATLEKERKAKAAAAAAAKREAEERAKEQKVWVSGSGGCYHSKSSCSNMRDPWQVTLSKAKEMGRRPCKKCY